MSTYYLIRAEKKKWDVYFVDGGQQILSKSDFKTFSQALDEFRSKGFPVFAQAKNSNRVRPVTRA